MRSTLDAPAITESVSRRSVLGGALAASGLLDVDDATAATGDATGPDGEPTARVYLWDLHPGARFDVVSRPLDYKPRFDVQEGESFLVDMYWAGHETRIVRYANTRERVLCFPEQDTVTRGERYRFEDDHADTRLTTDVVAVGFDSVTGGE